MRGRNRIQLRRGKEPAGLEGGRDEVQEKIPERDEKKNEKIKMR